MVPLLSCEHASFAVPPELGSLFAPYHHVLRSHRAWDPGALAMAADLANNLGVELIAASTTRLICDANRSPTNPEVFSRFTAGLPEREKQRLLSRYHLPHWRRIERAIEAGLRQGEPVLHLAIHSFVPVLRGKVREVDLGLLYDPGRKRELAVARKLAFSLQGSKLGLRVRHNAPYRGIDDALPTAQRRQWKAHQYLGMEIELNQQLLDQPSRLRKIGQVLVHAVETALG